MDWDRTKHVSIEAETVLVIDRDTLFSLHAQIASCEKCRPGAGEASVEMLLDGITGSDPTTTSYFLGLPLHCPQCANRLSESEMVEWEWKGRGGK